MKTVGAIRLENLLALITEAGTMEAAAVKAETSSVYLSQVRNRTTDKKTGRPREMGTSMARRLEIAFGKLRGWMDVDHADQSVPFRDLQPFEVQFITLFRTLPDDAQHEALVYLNNLHSKTHGASSPASAARPFPVLPVPLVGSGR